MSIEHIAPRPQQILSDVPHASKEYTPPRIFDLGTEADQQALRELKDSGAIIEQHDELDATANALFEIRHPANAKDKTARANYVANILEQGEQHGRIVYYPDTKTVVHMPSPEDLFDIQRFRDRDLRLRPEQEAAHRLTVAVLGLSVGRKVVRSLVESGVGGTLVMADMDTIDPLNLNRLSTPYSSVGVPKVVDLAREISHVNPYIQQTHMPNGLTKESLAVLGKSNPDLIFEEMDNIQAKAMAREFARQEQKPLIMVTDLGHVSLLDVERYDIDKNTKPFGGRVKPADFTRILNGDISVAELTKYQLKIVGLRYVTTRMLQSVMQNGKTLGGLPQLGDTAAMGGSLASKAAYEMLSGGMPSGRYVASGSEILKMKHQASVPEGLSIVRAFVKAQKAAKAAAKIHPQPLQQAA